MKRKIVKSVFILFITTFIIFSCDVNTDDKNSNVPIITSLKITNLSSYILYDVKYSSKEFGNIAIGDTKTKELSPNNTSIPVFFTLMVNGNPVQCRTNDIKSIAEGNNDDWIINNSNSISTITGGINGTLSFVYNKLSKPILELSQNNKQITNNDPISFDFGKVELNTNNQLVFNIKNIGNLPLELNGTPIIESSNSIFSIPVQPTTTTINPGGTVAFLIRYTPTEEKEDSGTITIYNNSDDLVFTFNLKGTGYLKKPQITIKQGNTTINQNGEYNFGSVFYSEQKDIVFTIGNSGEAALIYETVDGNRINIINNSQNHFTIITQPSATMTVAPGSTNTFTVRYKPTATGSNFSTIVKIKTNSQNNEEFAFTLKGSSELIAPGGVTAVYQQSKSILVSWNPVQGATSYNVYYGTSSTAINVLAGSGLTETLYTHTGLSDGTTYYYCITAQSGGSESTRSQTVSRLTPPGIPTNLRSTGSAYNSIALAWNTVTGAASYVIQRSTSSNGTFSQIGTSYSATYTDTNLTPLTTYYYKVIAQNTTSNSEASDIFSAQTSAIPIPANVTASSQTAHSVYISWSAVSGASSYRVYRSETASGTYTQITSTSNRNYTDTGLLSSTTYYYKVSTVISTGAESTQSASVTATTPAVPILAPPANVNAFPIPSGICVSWSYVSNAAGYTVYRSTSATGTYTAIATNIKDTNSSTQNYKDTTTGSTTYFYKVATVNSAGVTGSQSGYVSSPGPGVLSTLPYYDDSNLYWADTITGTGVKYYYFRLQPYYTFSILWADKNNGGNYFTPSLTGSVIITAYEDDGYDLTGIVSSILFSPTGTSRKEAQDIIIKVSPVNSSSGGTFALKYYYW